MLHCVLTDCTLFHDEVAALVRRAHRCRCTAKTVERYLLRCNVTRKLVWKVGRRPDSPAGVSLIPCSGSD